MSESNVADYLGFSVVFMDLIDVAQFLTGRIVDNAQVRRLLAETDGDPKEAVLRAYGLDNETGRKSFDSIESLKFKKSLDPLAKPQTVQYMAGENIAKQLMQAYKDDEVKPVQLGGKHSAGSYIAKLNESNWLLKPGYNSKISPAAGMSETNISQSRRESCFAEIAKDWGIQEIQPVSLLAIDGKEIACIRMWPLDWVNLSRAQKQDQNLSTRVLMPYLNRGTIHKWGIIDFVLGNVDRHGQNIMVGPDGHVGLIDHGSTFAGKSFDPANDEDSFIPYYFRVFARSQWSTRTTEEKLAGMPKCGKQTDQDLKKWFESLSKDRLAAKLYAYGVDPAACMERLEKLRLGLASPNFSKYINSLWVET